MNTPIATDIVLVSFSKELPMLELCLKSIAVHMDAVSIGSIFLFWNEDNGISESIRNQIYDTAGLLRAKIKIRQRPDLIDISPHTVRPWRLQQALKLMAARIVDSNFYLVLDTKNHFLRPFGHDDLYTASGKPKSAQMDYPPGSFLDFLKRGLTYFDTNFEERHATGALPTTTPVMLSADITKKLINYAEQKEDLPFDRAFLTTEPLRFTAEFLLYYAYLLRTEGSFDAIYEPTKRSCVTFFTTDPDTEEKIQRKLDALEHSETKILGIHRNRYLNLSPTEEKSFTNTWETHGLFNNVEAAHAHMHKTIKHLKDES